MRAERVTRVAVFSSARELSQPILPTRAHRAPRRLVDEEMRSRRSRRPASNDVSSTSAREPGTTVPKRDVMEQQDRGTRVRDHRGREGTAAQRGQEDSHAACAAMGHLAFSAGHLAAAGLSQVVAHGSASPRAMNGMRPHAMAATVPGTPSPTSTLSSELERVRLEHRARRLRLVVAVLREHARLARASGPMPRGLQQAITDFSAQLTEVDGALDRTRGGADCAG